MSLRSRMGPDAVRASWTAGRAATFEEALELAFQDGDDDAVHPEAPGGLSSREVEVTILVASGLRDRAIGERLHISARTVGKHVEHIRDKLALDTRSQLGAWAAHVGLLDVADPA